MIRRVLLAVAWLFGLAYPGVVYLGLERWDTRTLSLLLLAVLVPAIALRLVGAARAHVLAVLRVPAVIIGILALGALLDDARLVLALPALVNGALLFLFASSMRGERCMVERFALLEVAELTPEMARYCRSVNLLWCGFFVINGTTAATLSVTGPTSLWALYTGALSYLLMGTLFALEYMVRLLRFPELRPWRAGTGARGS